VLGNLLPHSRGSQGVQACFGDRSRTFSARPTAQMPSMNATSKIHEWVWVRFSVA